MDRKITNDPARADFARITSQDDAPWGEIAFATGTLGAVLVALARRVGEPGSARAVANACAANAIALAIPCHRVVRSDGTFSGYRWGVERKRALLARETQGLKAPRKARKLESAAARRRNCVAGKACFL